MSKSDPSPSDIFGPGDLSEHDLLLIELYRKLGRPLDWLAYTEEFEQLYGQLQKAGDRRSQADVFRRLLNLRKSGRLPRVA